MAKEKMPVIDSDHEIEEFLQTYIVEKITSGYEAVTTEIKQGVCELREKVNSIKNAGNSTNQDVSVLLRNDEFIQDNTNQIKEDTEKLTRKVESLINLQSEIKLSLPDEVKIADALTPVLKEIVEEKTLSIQNDIFRCFDEDVLYSRFENIIRNEAQLSTNESTDKMIRKIEEHLSDFMKLVKSEKEDVIQFIESRNQVVKLIDEKTTELSSNDKMIKLSNFYNNAKLLWIVIGIDTIIIAGVLIAYIFK